ncbi:hypothetical protein TD95_002569 [Thielaviopsis punctulata]|uniref:Aminotransferase class I/classII large domain-containing protein n=1 Tax=Thielaviopsis punctulata TaxID=72032 RepID=A0A0F4ZLP4_9PEZI|nr:hypothetical protein TD95_002569 [Thielaviopsis punctulata]
MSLSDRALVVSRPSALTKIWEVIANAWHPDSNPSGYVSLGVAENSLMHSELAAKLPAPADIPHSSFTYGDGPSGSQRLKKALAAYLNHRHNPVTRVLPQHIIATNGCSAAIEQLSWALANPGDVWLLGQPFYGTFQPDLTLRPTAVIQPVAFGAVDGQPAVDPLSLEAVTRYEAALEAVHVCGQKVAGLVLCNPHNPLGRCYPRETIEALMELCGRHSIHLIVDELYALSVWKNTVDSDTEPAEFVSTLSIPLENKMDPQLLHVLWGMSKDFGANGIRMGMIIDQYNEPLRTALGTTALYSSVSSLTDAMTAAIFEDEAWVDAYVAENSRRLARHFELLAAWAKDNSVPYVRGANAGFFLWVNLGEVYRQRHAGAKTAADNSDLMEALLAQRVFLASGANFGSEEAGWFRIVFSVDEAALREGLRRIERALF